MSAPVFAVLAVVFVAANVFALVLARAWWQYAVLMAVDAAVMFGAVAGIVVASPSGEGWDGRIETYGHWVEPTAQYALLRGAGLFFVLCFVVLVCTRAVRLLESAAERFVRALERDGSADSGVTSDPDGRS